MSHALVWFRRDLRLADNPALQAAIDAGHVPIPVYVHAPDEEGDWRPGVASRAWLDRSLRALAGTLQRLGSDLVVLHGDCGSGIEALARLTGARAVFWGRCYEPALIDRDREIKLRLRGQGLEARSFNASLLIEPWAVHTGQGTPYRVFTPFWRAAQARLNEARPLALPHRLPALPDAIPALQRGLEAVDSLGLVPKPRWDRGFWERFTPGEAGALELLDAFIEGAADSYLDQRDLPDRAGTSRLSPHLHFGEISPSQVLARLRDAAPDGSARRHVDGYVRELGWREFSHHLLFHFPKTPDENLNPRFDGFAWVDPGSNPGALEAWQQGRTGVPIVDAGMRELWHTGWMHNRVRMVVASFLTKNLRMHWLHGARWFWDTLVDADLANNTQGWQWSAGTGADAAPHFRIFNPASQASRFDAGGRYVRRWCPELARVPDRVLPEPWAHPRILEAHAPDWPRKPIVDLKASREAALAAYQACKAAR